jgi:hypothetical protein
VEQYFVGVSVPESSADEAEEQTGRRATPPKASVESVQADPRDVEPSAAPVDLVSSPNSFAVAASQTPFVVVVVVDICQREETPGTHWVLTVDPYFGDKPDTCSSDVL